jgi:hypothetical protein
MNLNFKELRIGGFFLLVGLAFGVEAYLRIPIGSPARMGPGFFPIVLSAILFGLGALICLQGFRSAAAPMNYAPLRGLALVMLAPIVFGYTVRGLGFLPSVAITTALTALASPGRKPIVVAALSIGLAAFCAVVFILGAGIPIDLIGPWLKP